MNPTHRYLLRPATLLGLVVLLAFPEASRAAQVVVWGTGVSGQTNLPVTLTNAVAIAAGRTHLVAAGSDWNVSAWGSFFAQTNVPLSVTSIVAVAAGWEHSLALRADGTIASWGNNVYGQTNVPKSSVEAVAIAAGRYFSAALYTNHTIRVWGFNSHNQTTVPGSLTNAIAIAAGGSHLLGLRADGTVVAWGYGLNGQTNVPPGLTNVVAVAAGELHSMALKADGTVEAWGDNGFGQCNVPAGLTNVIAIAAGGDQCMALLADHTVVSWGRVVAPAGLTNVIAIAVGHDNGMALVSDGAPFLTRPPKNYSSFLGDTLVLSPHADGFGTLTYQWSFNGNSLPDETNSTLTITGLAASHLGIYSVVISNEFGTLGPVPLSVSAVNVAIWGKNTHRQTTLPPELTNAVAVAAGSGHCIALKSDGSVVAWGKSPFVNSNTIPPSPPHASQTNVPAGLTNAIAVAAGSDHSLALRNDGTVIAWGRHWDGQTNVPASATNVIAIDAGWAHSIALRANGTVVAWGNDEYNQSEVSFLATEVIAIAAGHYHNLALRADRTVVSWGWLDTVPANATNVVAIDAGWQHSLALRADGTIVAWGDNTYGQLNVPDSATNIIAVAAGWYHNLALRADGKVIAWGRGACGVTNVPATLPDQVVGIAIGDDVSIAIINSRPPEFYPQRLSAIARAGQFAVVNGSVTGARPLSLQWYHDGEAIPDATNRTLVLQGLELSDSGDYVLMATNALGDATGQPITLTVAPDPETITGVGVWGDVDNNQAMIPLTLKDPRAISAGAFHNLVLNSDGTVSAWGKSPVVKTNSFSTNTLHASQTNVPASATNIIDIAAGGDHSMALRDDGTVIAWGRHWDGQTNVPASASNVMSIAAGWAHSLALRADGTVVAWGNNEFGQTDVPPYLNKVIAIAAGYYHTLALRSDRTVVSWGNQYTVPASVTNVVAISAGWGHSLAVRADGSVVAWGDNSHGQLNVPASATNIIAVAAGWYHNLALRADGTVVAWGRNFYGVTTLPAYMDNVTSIAAGENHNLVLREIGPPRIDLLPAVTVHVGESVLLNAHVSGTHPLAFQWFHNDTPIPGATNRYLLIPYAWSAHAGNYVLAVSNPVGQSTSTPLTLTVLPDPAITSQAPARTAYPQAPLCLYAYVAGQPPLSFEWYRDGVKVEDNDRISGATTPFLCFTQAEYQDNGTYTLVVSNEYGTVTALIARLAVTPILAWGDNSSGQLDVPGAATNVLMIAAGFDHNLALLADGNVAAWGDNSFGQCTVPLSISNAVHVAAGVTHSLAALADGTVIGWGNNSSGQLDVPAGLSNVIAVAAGETHSAALLQDSRVVAWGTNSNAQVGMALSVTNAVANTAGGFQTAVLRENGTIFSFGGHGSTVPALATNLVAVATANNRKLALRSDGALFVWGGATGYDQLIVPLSASNAIAVAAGDYHNLILQTSGTVVGWGANESGQTDVPDVATNLQLIAISGGGAHSLALIGDGPPALFAPLGAPVKDGDNFSVSLPTQNGRVYAMEFTDSLTEVNWTALPLAAGNGTVIPLTDPSATNAQRFYRVRKW